MDENVRRGYDITMKHLNFKNLCMILLGNTIYALAIVMFILPNNMITGGTTGLVLRSIIISDFQSIVLYCYSIH